MLLKMGLNPMRPSEVLDRAISRWEPVGVGRLREALHYRGDAGGQSAAARQTNFCA